MLEYENMDNIYRNPDWYFYIWNKLNCSFDEIEKNGVSFITFNYDRTLETYLLNSITALYNKNDSESNDKLSSIPIVHLHGKLGKNKFESPNSFVEFGQELNDSGRLLDASGSIKIVHENIDQDIEFAHAYELLYNAELIVILGLGYDDNNLRRLKIESIKGHIIGSSYGLTSMEQRNIVKKYPNIQCDTNGMKQTLDFLRNEVLIE